MEFYDRTLDPARAAMTLSECLEVRAQEQGTRMAYRLLGPDERERSRLDYAELERATRAIALELTARKLRGQTAVLLYPNDLDFVCAFLGCLRAGVVAVPCYPPSGPDKLTRFAGIVRDCGAQVLLSNSSLRTQRFEIERQSKSSHESGNVLSRLEVIETDSLPMPDRSADSLPLPDPESVAFLQYTSGSTAEPKGVMVTHSNVMVNAATILENAKHPEGAPSVSWLPLYHDMGLIGAVGVALFAGIEVILMSPLDFLRRPAMWLRTISRYRAATTGAPNFGYELCLSRISSRHCTDLDLSCWVNAFNGAERVRASTLSRFSEKFAEYGFRPEVFLPCYGLAETTLMVSGSRTAEIPATHGFDRASLESGVARSVESDSPNAQLLVGCGTPRAQDRVQIVDPLTCRPLPQCAIGEVWVSGPSVARGYWRRPELTKEHFHAELVGAAGEPYLRTGDLGFFDQGELFITGRIKELMIVRGRNYAPQDLEQLAEQVSPEIRPTSVAAFACVAPDGDEQAVVVCELRREQPQAEYRELAQAVRARIGAALELSLFGVAFVPPGSLPKTSSGKLRRVECRKLYEADALPLLFLDRTASATDDLAAESSAEFASGLPSVTADSSDAQIQLLRQMLAVAPSNAQPNLLEPFLRVRIAESIGVPAEQLPEQGSLPELGLDSLRALDLQHSLEDLLECELPVRELLEAPSLRTLIERALAARSALGAPGQTPREAPRATRADDGSLSHGQAAIWFVQAQNPDTPAYNVHLALDVRGLLDKGSLEQSVSILSRRHPILRTAIQLDGGTPRQLVLDDAGVALSFTDASRWSEAHWREAPAQLSQRSFDLGRGEVARFDVLTRSPDEHRFVIALHHVAVDFWSIVTLVHELRILYPAIAAGSPPALPPLARSYTDFVHWQERYLSERGEQAARFWDRQLGGELERLDLPLDHPRPARPSFRGGSVAASIDTRTTEALRALARSRGTTLYTTLLAAFYALLHRYTGQQDIVVGTPVAGRPDTRFAGVVGYFTNPVALRARPRGDMSFESLLKHVRDVVLDALDHQHYPFSLVVERLRPEREADLWPLYQVAFTLQTAHLSSESELAGLALGESDAHMQWGELRVESVELHERVENFDLKLVMAETSSGLRASFQYNADLFEQDTLATVARHFQALLQRVAIQPELPLWRITLLSPEERSRILSVGAHAGAPGRATRPPASETDSESSVETREPRSSVPFVDLAERFAQQARRTPRQIAVETDDGSFSYAELDAYANRIALALRRRGVGLEAPVAPLLPRSPELIAAMLGILKAGGCYVALDPDTPPARLATILDQAGVRHVITDRPVASTLPDISPPESSVPDSSQPDHSLPHLLLPEGLAPDLALSLVDASVELGSGAHDALTPTGTLPESLAYIVFTSGSTGTPRGVGIPQRGLLGLCDWHAREYGIRSGDRASWLARLSFDAAVWEVWPYLLSGATLCLPADEHLRADPSELRHWIARVSLTHCFLATPIAERILREDWREPPPLRALLTGGDRLGPCTGAAPSFALYNHYGPSESSVVATQTQVVWPSPEPPAIGQPISGTETYVLDEWLEPMPIGATGELYLGGIALARGYVGQPARTAERFVPHPYSGTPGARLYRTGDRVRLTQDGQLHFVGRADHQIKLRGNRIELGEIENALLALEGVDAAAVVLRDDPSRLVAYVHGEPPRTAIDANPSTADRSEGSSAARAHVDAWSHLYDETYAGAASDVRADFDITGWNSSYTGTALPPEEMEEWVNDTVGLLRTLLQATAHGSRTSPARAAHVFEIGCGTGLLLQRLIDDCELYVGTDLSQVAIDTLRERLADTPRGAAVELACLAAHESWPESKPVDCVILNSVVQYFPSAQYLFDVLERALARVVDGGTLFLGDLRVLPWLEPFLADLAIEHAAPSARASQLRQRIAEMRARLTELVLDPYVLADWLRAQPRVSRVELRIKPGAAANEMNRFRCDLIAWLRPRTPTPVEVEHAWDDTLDLAALLDRAAPPAFAVRGIPNPRITRPAEISCALEEAPARESVAELRRRLAESFTPETRQGIDPSDLARLVQARGLHVELHLAEEASEYDALFYRHVDDAHRFELATSSVRTQTSRAGVPANDPLREQARRQWIPTLRQQLAARLPDYMLPAQIVSVAEWPLTPTGKLDRRALPSPDPVTARSEHVAARNPREELLTELWCEVLGIDRVGVHDGFFELGGDSILSIQLVHRARERGLELSARDLFEHQTIAQLARVARAHHRIEAPQGRLSGPIAWTPISAFWRELQLSEPSYFNQALLLEVPQGLEVRALERALAQLCDHHDMLRLRMRSLESSDDPASRSHLEIDEFEGNQILDVVQLDPPCNPPEIEHACAAVQAKLDLEHGPVFRALLLQCPGLERDRLMFAAHHLAVDAVSWRILIEDLWQLLLAELRGVATVLPAKTTPFSEYAASLSALARDPALERQRELWTRHTAPTPPLPTDHHDGANTEASRAELRVELDRSETSRLLRDAATAYRVRVDEILLTALSRAVAQWTSSADVALDYERHGREESLGALETAGSSSEPLDLSRTVGWFTARIPLRLHTSADLEDDLCNAKDAVRSLPLGGLGYGLLRYLADEPLAEGASRRELAFNYLGRIDRGIAAGVASAGPESAETEFAGTEFDRTERDRPASGSRDASMLGDSSFAVRRAPESPGALQAPADERPYLIDINAAVTDDVLELRFAYSRARHARSTIEQLATSVLRELSAISALCERPGAGRLTPSDFPLANVSPSELEAVCARHPEIEDLHAMTALQEGLWLHSRMADDRTTYLVQLILRFEQPLDWHAFEHAWRDAVRRHSILRSTVWGGATRPLIVIEREVRCALEVHDLSTHGSLEAWLEQDRVQGFDLEAAPLFRLARLDLGGGRCAFVFTHHHLILDGWSLSLLLEEVLRRYSASGQLDKLELPPATPFRSHVRHTLERSLRGYAEFWREELLERPSEALLPTRAPRGHGAPRGHDPRSNANGSKLASAAEAELAPPSTFTRVRRPLDPMQMRRIEQGARERGLTLHTVSQGAFALALARASGRNDLVIGTVTSGRAHARAEAIDMVGLLIETLPLRVQVPLGRDLESWLTELQDRHLRACEHPAPLAGIEQWVGAGPSAPLLECLFAFENYPLDPSLFEQSRSIGLESVEFWDQTHYPLTWVVSPHGARPAVDIGYDREHLSDTQIADLWDAFEGILRAFAAAPLASGMPRLCDLTPFGDAASTRLHAWSCANAQELAGFERAAEAKRPIRDSLLGHFDYWVSEQPHARALLSSSYPNTYLELDRASRQLAQLLKRMGAGSETRVSARLPRDARWIVSFLATLATGATFVPIDLEQPDARIRAILDDATPLIMILPSELPQEAYPQSEDSTPRAGGDMSVLRLDPELALLRDESPLPSSGDLHPDLLAYVIYTSGSTGTPKGVGIPRRALDTFLTAVRARFDFEPTDRFSVFHSPGFDVSVWEIFVGLATGASLFIVPEELRRDPKALLEALAEKQVTVLSQTPSAFDALLATVEHASVPSSLRWVVLGGEPLQLERIAVWRDRTDSTARIGVGYGPTETTIYCTFDWVDTSAEQLAGPAPIGLPLAEFPMHVIGENGMRVAPGFAGDLWIGGPGIARGYLGRARQTAESFVPDPFSPTPGGRLYRSGDHVRYLDDGRLLCLGRLDGQIKLRGYRIELGEVEAQLGRCAGVERAVVILRTGQSGRAQLVGYLVPTTSEKRQPQADPIAPADSQSPGEAGSPGEAASTSPNTLDLNAIRAQLAETLPGYMIPQSLVVLERLPLTPRGKLDRRALPAPESPLEGTTTPTSEMESVLHGLWSDLLGRSDFGIDDDFFELGGDSILAVQLASRAHARGLVVSPRQIFETPTIAQLAPRIEGTRAIPARQGVVSGDVPLTPVQAWWTEQDLSEPHHWNQAILLEVHEPYAAEAVERALAALVSHHDALRLTFTREKTGWKQWNAAEVDPVKLSWIDLRQTPDSELAAEIESACAPLHRSFDLVHGPLLCAAYLDLGPARADRLFLCAHHLAVDGVSWRILLEDLEFGLLQASSGRAIELPPKTTAYLDWATHLLSASGLSASANAAHTTDSADAAPCSPEGEDSAGCAPRGPLEEPDPIEFWTHLDFASTRSLPRDFDRGANLESASETVTYTLDRDTTTDLIQHLAAAYSARPDELMLSVLADTLCAWSGDPAVAILLEGHGREALFDDVDLTRTVGWFTSLYPVVLPAGGRDADPSPLTRLKHNKELLRSAPENGCQFGRLRYLAAPATRARLASLPVPEISFNHLGRLDTTFGNGSTLGAAREPIGPTHSPSARRAHLIDVTTLVRDGVLELAWTYSTHHYHRTTIERLAGEHLDRLRALLEACLAGEDAGLTPTDFPLAAGLDQEALDRLLGDLES